jgi:hypothetical protein
MLVGGVGFRVGGSWVWGGERASDGSKAMMGGGGGEREHGVEVRGEVIKR